MTRKHPVCLELEPDLIATATGEAETHGARRVQEHVARCAPCRDDLARYQAVDQAVGTLRAPVRGDDDAAARARLMERLADIQSRVVSYAVFPSPVGPILIARSEQGVALVEYFDKRRSAASLAALEAREDPTALEGLHRELLDYFAGRRTRFDWPLDLRLARSDFHRAVLQATAAVPYGAVTSYAGIARDIGQPRAVRAVAQALRHNPVPIVVPCHRIVGSAGDLTGYSGPRIDLKERLLAVEGVPTVSQQARVARRAMYHLDRGEREYCLPSCGTIVTRPVGSVMLFGSRDRAEAIGLQPCTTCRPDLFPLAS